MATRESYMYMYTTLWQNFQGILNTCISFICNFLRKILVSDKKIHRTYNSYKFFLQNPLEKFFIFTIYQKVLAKS